jgi:hypothetical protein
MELIVFTVVLLAQRHTNIMSACFWGLIDKRHIGTANGPNERANSVCVYCSSQAGSEIIAAGYSRSQLKPEWMLIFHIEDIYQMNVPLQKVNNTRVSAPLFNVRKKRPAIFTSLSIARALQNQQHPFMQERRICPFHVGITH